MKVRDVDVAIIGAGTAGLAAYREAKALNVSVILIEGHQYGTTCARVGCMPSKLLIAAAEAAHNFEIAEAFGILPQAKPLIDGYKVMSRVKTERDRFVAFALSSVEAIAAEDKVKGMAKFISDTRIEISLKDGSNLHLNTKRTIIATGSHPDISDHLKALGNKVIVSDDIFNWNTLPESIAIIGPGVIGLELGQALSRLGVKIIILGRGGRVGPVSDPEIRDYIVKQFSLEFPFYPDAKIVDLKSHGSLVSITYQPRGAQPIKETFNLVLSAIGRKPNTNGLGLENTTLILDKNNVPTFDKYTMQCKSRIGESSIFIAGDVNNDLPLLHEAADEGKIAGVNAGNYPKVKPGLRRAQLGIVFTDPQIAIIGGGKSAAQHIAHVVGHASFEDQGRSRIMLKNQGLLNVYADKKTGEFLGAEMFGPSAEHIGHLLAWALQNKMTINEMLDMPFYHPVIEEGLRTALRNARNKL